MQHLQTRPHMQLSCIARLEATTTNCLVEMKPIYTNKLFLSGVHDTLCCHVTLPCCCIQQGGPGASSITESLVFIPYAAILCVGTDTLLSLSYALLHRCKFCNHRMKPTAETSYPDL